MILYLKINSKFLCCQEEGPPSVYQDTLLATMVNADLQVMMIRACCQDLCAKSYPSPFIIHAIFNIMKVSAHASSKSVCIAVI